MVCLLLECRKSKPGKRQSVSVLITVLLQAYCSLQAGTLWGHCMIGEAMSYGECVKTSYSKHKQACFPF